MLSDRCFSETSPCVGTDRAGRPVAQSAARKRPDAAQAGCPDFHLKPPLARKENLLAHHLDSWSASFPSPLRSRPLAISSPVLEDCGTDSCGRLCHSIPRLSVFFVSHNVPSLRCSSCCSQLFQPGCPVLDHANGLCQCPFADPEQAAGLAANPFRVV